MKKIIIASVMSLLLTFNVSAGTDGENILTKNDPSKVKDCFENINRATFKFNQAIDGVLFEPVAKAYRALPSPMRTGTSNALVNLSSLVTIPNNVLQGDLKTAGVNTGRFIINTTVGIFGLFDVATKMGFSEYEKEDYGQTLAVWGMGPGCYVVLPVLGPSTIRDTAGSDTLYASLSSSFDTNDLTGINMEPLDLLGNTLPKSSGSLRVYISAASSSQFNFTKAQYDLEIYSGSNPVTVNKILTGQINLIKEVTTSP